MLPTQPVPLSPALRSSLSILPLQISVLRPGARETAVSLPCLCVAMLCISAALAVLQGGRTCPQHGVPCPARSPECDAELHELVRLHTIAWAQWVPQLQQKMGLKDAHRKGCTFLLNDNFFSMLINQSTADTLPLIHKASDMQMLRLLIFHN